MADPKYTIVTGLKNDGLDFKITKFAGENVYELTKTRIVVDTLKGTYVVELDDGFLTDGASVPDIFSCVREGWYKGTMRDIGAIVHDALYTIAGKCEGKTLTRSECDTLLQYIDLYTGATSKKQSWLVRIAVSLFAGGKKHWGNDSFKQRGKIHIEYYED